MTRFTTRPEILGTYGVVTSTHWIASAVGMGILEKGGNAFDAAVATGFALQCVEPHLNGPGGEAPILVHSAAKKKVEVICGQGVAPQAATIAAFDKLGLDLIPGTGLLPATVPGAFDAWMLLLRDYGTMSLAQVLEPALGMWMNGFPVVPRMTETIQTVETLFRDHWKTSAALYLPGDKPVQPGTLFSNPVLGKTYERVLTEAQAAGGDRIKQIEAARKTWYQGFVAQAIDTFCRTQSVMDVSGRPHFGLMTGDDMARWHAPVESPLTYDYGRYTIAKCGPWNQGPVLLQQLALLSGSGIDKLDPTSPEFVHLAVEAAKLAFADREQFYGDPDFAKVPIQTLLSKPYNDERRKLIGDRASLELRPGTVDGFNWRLDAGAATKRAGLKRGAGAGEPTVGTLSGSGAGSGEPTTSKMGHVRGDTVHLDIIDRHGNMVSATPSGGWLQSSPIIPELGLCLGTRGQMFWLDAKAPAALVPGKRPRSTLSPGIALRDGEAYLAFGTPGGDQQDQWATQLLLRHIHAGQNLQEAIDCPAFHTEHILSSFWPRTVRTGVVVVEGRMPKATIEDLRKRGHTVEVGDDWSEGRLTAAARDGRMLKAAANPRGMQGYAVGR